MTSGSEARAHDRPSLSSTRSSRVPLWTRASMTLIVVQAGKASPLARYRSSRLTGPARKSAVSRAGKWITREPSRRVPERAVVDAAAPAAYRRPSVRRPGSAAYARTTVPPSVPPLGGYVEGRRPRSRAVRALVRWTVRYSNLAERPRSCRSLEAAGSLEVQGGRLAGEPAVPPAPKSIFVLPSRPGSRSPPDGGRARDRPVSRRARFRTRGRSRVRGTGRGASGGRAPPRAKEGSRSLPRPAVPRELHRLGTRFLVGRTAHLARPWDPSAGYLARASAALRRGPAASPRRTPSVLRL